MITDQAPTGLYLHIPYCRHLCGYCAFAKTDKGAFSETEQANYLNALEKEFEMHRESITPLLRTLYIGGGTPSRLTAKNLRRLLNLLEHRLSMEQLGEKTFEINPEDLIERPGLLDQLQDHGIDRVSMGLQTFSPLGIEVLERKTSKTQNLEAMDILFSKFQGRISIDLILGWPGQDLNALEDDLQNLSNYPVGHYSTYLLNYEPGTRLERDRKKGLLKCLDEDTLADVWESFQSYCLQRGYKHYEISSFCLPGQQSLHNTSTWEGYPYLGLGAGAVSRLGTKRWTNFKNPKQYIETCLSRQAPRFESEHITEQMHWEEDLLLSLRHDKGLNLQGFKNQHGLDLLNICSHDLTNGLQDNSFKIINEHLIMTPKGWQLFDHWISNWMLKLERFSEGT